MSIIIAIVIVAVILLICWRLVCSQEDAGKEITRTEFAADIMKFIDGSASAKDSDEVYTFTLADPKIEKIRKEVIDILDRRFSSKTSGWCDEQGAVELQKIRETLLSDAASLNQSATANALDVT